jgi:hypothetical protein
MSEHGSPAHIQSTRPEEHNEDLAMHSGLPLAQAGLPLVASAAVAGNPQPVGAVSKRRKHCGRGVGPKFAREQRALRPERPGRVWRRRRAVAHLHPIAAVGKQMSWQHGFQAATRASCSHSRA